MSAKGSSRKDPIFKTAFFAIKNGLKRPHMGLRMLLLTVGILLLGITVANLKLVDLGNDPLATVNFGLERLTGISYGTWHLTVMMLLFIPTLIWAPGKIGIGSLLNMTLIGYIADGVRWVTAKLMNGAALSETARILLFVASIAVFLVGASFYTAADLGYASYDCIPYILSNRIRRLKFRTVRMIWDLSFALTGFLMGSTIGPTTLVLGFCLGPAISFFAEKMAPTLESDPTDTTVSPKAE